MLNENGVLQGFVFVFVGQCLEIVVDLVFLIVDIFGVFIYYFVQNIVQQQVVKIDLFILVDFINVCY